MTDTGDLPHPPLVATDPSIPLANLSAIRNRVDSLSRHLSNSLYSSTVLSPVEMDSISSELISAIHQVIISGASLLASQSRNLPDPNPSPIPDHPTTTTRPAIPDPETTTTAGNDDDGDDFEIVEIDAVEMLAEHIHFCQICGKGFKRDANLRMHMRAHGNQYKTPQALVKSDITQIHLGFSCPYEGCNRNKHTVNFRPLKSLTCVKNHFKRSHCPKMYTCTRCNKKSFSVIADLKSHLGHCGDAKWQCSCGASFPRKDKLFGHMALFDGHMPAIDVAKAVVEEDEVVAGGGSSSGGGFEFDELLEGNMVMDDIFRF